MKKEISPYTAVVGFAAWLTTREGSLLVGASHEAGTMARLVNAYCKAQGLDMSEFDHEALNIVPEEEVDE